MQLNLNERRGRGPPRKQESLTVTHDFLKVHRIFGSHTRNISSPRRLDSASPPDVSERSHLLPSVLGLRDVSFSAIVTTVSDGVRCELSECSLNRLFYLVQQGVSGCLVIARRNEGCENACLALGLCACSQDEDEDLIDACVRARYLCELARSRKLVNTLPYGI